MERFLYRAGDSVIETERTLNRRESPNRRRNELFATAGRANKS